MAKLENTEVPSLDLSMCRDVIGGHWSQVTCLYGLMPWCLGADTASPGGEMISYHICDKGIHESEH